MIQNRHARRANQAKSRKTRKVASPDDGSAIFLSRHPLSGVSQEVLKQELPRIGDASAASFETSMEAAKAYFQRFDPLVTLAAITVRNILEPAGPNGIQRPIKRSQRITQSHIEFAQVLALTSPIEQSRMPSSPHLHSISQTLEELLQSHQLRDLRRLRDSQSAEDDSSATLQARLRGHTLMVRNWGYFDHVIDILSELLAPLEPHLRSRIGLSAKELLALMQTMMQQVEKRAFQQLSKNSAWVCASTRKSMHTAFYKAFGYSEEAREREWSEIQALRLSKNELSHYLNDRLTALLPSIFWFSVEHLANDTGLPFADVQRALMELSLPLQSRAQSDAESWLLDNPVWKKPLMQAGEDHFYLFLPMAFFSHSFRIFNDLLCQTDKTARAYTRRRTAYLEQAIAGVFARKFTDAFIDTNVRWSTLNGEGETDVLVRVDTQLFIIEAKSGRVTEPALRGGLKRAKKHAEELLIHPAQQSYRLAEILCAATSEQPAGFEIKTNVPLDGITRITRLAVTLEDLATHQSHLPALAKQLGLDLDETMPAALLLSDLKAVFEVLECPTLCMHYLVRRAEVQDKVSFWADELDLLGFYLRSAFSLSPLKPEGRRFMLTGMSQAIDEYFVNRRLMAVQKPERQFTKWFQAMIERMDARKLTGRSEALLLLASVPFDDQVGLEKSIENHRQALLTNSDQTDEVVVGRVDGIEDACLAVLITRETKRGLRLGREKDVAGVALDHTGTNQCLLITVDLKDNVWPYRSCSVCYS